MNPGQRESESKRLKASKIWIDKLIEKENVLSDIGGKIC